MGEDRPFQFKPNGKKFKAGGEVLGTVTPMKDLSKARGVDISLAYREGTENMIHFEPYAAVTVGEGGVEKGDELPFELTLPITAVPSCESKHALVGWTVWAQADIKRGQDVKGFEFIDVTPGPTPPTRIPRGRT